MTASKINVNSVKHAKLLELAHFLTRFQNHYSTPNDHFGEFGEGDSHQEESGNILITIKDLEAVTEYRRNLSKRETLKDRYYAAKETSKTKSFAQPICSLQAKRLENEIEIFESKINNISNRGKRIHCLLQRFEVWTTKILAQKDFVAPCDALLEDPKKTKYSHFSAHLNIPCSDHFCKILPGVSHNEWSIPRLPSAVHQMPEANCTLPLTPNKHTWQEFAKISRMLSLLDETSRTEIYKSSSCIFDSKGKNSYKELYDQNFDFQPLDLMALWVRAQRNSQAMRHLHLLFELLRVGPEDEFSVGVGAENEEQNPAERSTPKLRAICRGNPKSARQRICEITPWVDRLVEWAVVNQTLFSHHHVKTHIQFAFMIRKRKRQDEEEKRSERQRKRPRREGTSDEQELEKLRQACQVFVLRWFGRRHRKLTSVLFSKKQNILHLDIGCRKGDRNGANLLHEKVDAGIQNYLSKDGINGVVAFPRDRTLARIDRRIGNYGTRITLKSQVDTLLDALCSAGKTHGVRQELIETAKSDFHLLHRHYFEGPENALETAAMLLDVENESIESILNLLNGVPSPWKLHCAHCSVEGKESNPLRTCACCESPFHEGCTSWIGESMSETISSYPPLREVCAIQLPPAQTSPDFRDDSRVTWTEMEVVVERRQDDFGGLEMALGLSVSRTQSCYDSFDKLTNGTVLDLAKMIAADKSNQRPSFPMALKVDGSLIYDVADGGCAGKRAGLQKGDVIQDLQILELFNRANISSCDPERSFDFRNTSTSESLEAFRIPATKLKIRILRPSIDVVQSSRDWYEQVKVLNKACTAAMNDVNTGDILDTIWYCGNCQNFRTSGRPPPYSMKEEAEFCRAVVRRLGMESYAGPFETERTEGSATHPAASLRRLDAMMTDIINRQHLATKIGESSHRAFSNPACGLDGGSHLAWAAGLEEKPMELVCNGFFTLFKSVHVSSNGESRNVSDVTAIFRHFLVAFISWCVLPCKGNGRTKGPPSLFRNMHSPSILPSCSICTGRPVTAESSKVCNHPACSILARTNYFQMEDFVNEEVAALSDSIREYEIRSSLVGTTFLVHPDDPLVKSVSEVVKIEHNRRPVEFMIASYLPKEFRHMVFSGNSAWAGDSCSDGVGIFHLLPVISPRQMNYLLDRLKTRKKQTEIASTDDVAWASLEALNLAGVARYSFSQLERKLIESAKMRNAIEVAIVRKCMKQPSAYELFELRVSQLEPFNLVAFGNCLSSAASHLLLQANFQDGTAATEVTNSLSPHRRNWPIVPRKRNEKEQELFGQTLPLPHPVSLSCSSERKYDVLIPEEEEYELVYSDLHFENEQDCARLKKKLRPEKLEKPAEFNASSRSLASMTILLVNLEPGDESSGYQGIGWGFELVRWEHEGALRVGRICSPSPAQRAGLQTNDVITSVGGRKINSFDHVNLISTILGASNVCVRTDDSLVDPESTISIVLGNIAESCNLDPVVLNVYRPSQETDDRTTPDYPNPQQGRQQISQSSLLDSTRSPARSGDDDEVVVLRTTNHSNHFSKALQPASRNEFQESRAPQDPSRELGLGASSVPAAPSAQTQPTVPADYRQSLESFFSRLHAYDDRRPVISIDQLYFPAKNGVVFTLAETALFLDCFMRKQPKLGIRMLCPRYNPAVVYNEMKVMAKWPFSVIETMPKLSDQMYKSLLHLDHNRATSTEKPETGELVFKEVNPSGTGSRNNPFHWVYRYPVDRLPIDRCMERILADQQATRQQEQYQQQYPQQYQAQYQPQYQAQYQPQFHHQGNQPPQQYVPPPNPLEPPQQYGQLQNGMVLHQHYGPHPDPFEPGQQEYDNNQASYRGAHGERIRGGGTSTIDNRAIKRTRLSETSVEKWDGLPVYVFVQVDEMRGEKMLVGFVKSPPNVQLVSEMKINIEAHFLEDFGEFEATQMLKAESKEVFVVDMETKLNDTHGEGAVKVIKDLWAKQKGPAKYWVNGTNGTNSSIQIQDGGDQQVSMETINLNRNRQENSLENSTPANTQDQHTADTSDLLHQTEKASSARESSQIITDDTSSDVPTQSSPAPPPLKKMRGQMSCVGKLPDGRNCFWIANDPGALYLTTDELNDDKTTKICQLQYSCFLATGPLAQNQFHPRLMMRDVERYHCPWGCSLSRENDNDNIRETLSFISEEDLIDHCKECFSYEHMSGIIDVGHHRRCIRILEGQKIRDLYCDLSAALYARSSIFDFLSASAEVPIKTSKSGTRFSQSPTGKRLFLVIDEKLGSKIERLRESLSVQQSTIVCDLVQLLENLFCLFEVEKTGNLRFNNEELLKCCPVEETDSLPSMNAVESARLQDKKKSSKDSLCTNCVGCDLCVLPWEKTVPFDFSSSTDDKSEHSFGSGCCLINKLIRNSEMPKALPGSLGEAKVLLLEIGEIVPDQLKFRGKLTDFDHLSGHRLWDANNHDTWKRFVTGATCTRQLSQAYITLLASIEKNLLPSWWRTDGAGWSTTHAILVNGELSTLLLHVYVLDAAIAEYMCQKLYKKSTATTSPSKIFSPQRPKPKVTGTSPERMKKYMELAEKQGWSRYDGVNGSECCICEDGGDLLCCDLCPKVQHAGCCIPRIERDPKSLDIFICQVCINDIEEEMVLETEAQN